MRFRRRFASAGYLGLAVALGCSPVKTAAPAPGVDSALRLFLLDPTAECDPSLTGGAGLELQKAYRELLRTADTALALRVAEQAAGRDPDLIAAQVLRAEALLVASRPREAAGLLSPLAARARQCLALALVLGRTQEEAGEVPEAFATYLEAAARSDTASHRARTLSARALEVTRNRFAEALRTAHQEAAAWNLSRLERFWPDSETTLQSAMELARASEDSHAELAAIKALQAFHPQDKVLTLRRGQLELLVGNPRTGLALVEALAAAAPDDPALQTELALAKFSWRLLNAPEQVRGLREKVVLTRAEFAVLLYWTVPQIRTVRPGAAQIASDIVDHPSRDAIARVANLGLMNIDETMHRFSPDAGLRRSDAVMALLRLLADSGHGADAGGCGLPRTAGREGVCRTGVACGLLEDSVLCEAGSGLSGSEAIEMLRRALDRLEVE